MVKSPNLQYLKQSESSDRIDATELKETGKSNFKDGQTSNKSSAPNYWRSVLCTFIKSCLLNQNLIRKIVEHSLCSLNPVKKTEFIF